MQKITIYSTNTCAFCATLKNYLHDKGFAYEEKRVDSDPSLTQELFEKSGQLSVPFTVVEQADGSEEGIAGFDRKKINATLGIS